MYRYFDVHSHKNSINNANSDVLTVENIRISADHTAQILAPYFSVGIHPYDVEKITDTWLEELRAVALDGRCIAIGECGIDKKYPNLKVQIEILEQQINLSNRLQKPLIIHCVRAENEILNALKLSTQKVIFHGYAHFNQQIESRANIYFSLSERVLQSPTASKIPMERILMETDEGRLSIEEIYSRYSTIFGVSNIMFEEIIRNNFYNIFNKL